MTRCRCGARHATFAELPRVDVIDEPRLHEIVVRWPPGVVVDVRACSACGRPLARLVRTSA